MTDLFTLIYVIHVVDDRHTINTGFSPFVEHVCISPSLLFPSCSLHVHDLFTFKYLPWTAIQSLSSSSGGNRTTCLRSMPECNEALARLCRSYLRVPTIMFFFFCLNVWKKKEQITFHNLINVCKNIII